MFSELMSLFAIALGLSADAFAVTISDILCYPDLSAKKKYSLPVLFGLFQGAMPLAGYFLGLLFADAIESVDHWVALALLTVLGVKMILESVHDINKERKGDGDCQNADADRVPTKTLSYKTILVQAVATSIDAMAVGITLAVAVDLSIYLSAAVITVITFIMCVIGLYVGKLGRFLKNKAGIAGGIILILIGVKIFIEHMIGA